MRADFRPERTDSRPERAVFRPERANFRPERAWGKGTHERTDKRTKVPCVLQDFVPFGAAAQKEEEEEEEERQTRSPKGNMWSAIPVALVCMIVNWSERKQGSGPKGGEVL